MLLKPLLHVSTLAAYAVATAMLVANLLKERKRLVKASGWALLVGAALHLASVGYDYLLLARMPLGDVASGMTVLALLVVVGYLLVSVRKPLPAVGAFVTPAAVALLIIAEFKEPGSNLPAQAGFIRPLHIGMAMLGVAAFLIAFVAGVMYLVLERSLKAKRFGTAYQRFPSLEKLDSVNYRAIVVGFPLLTLGIVTGAMFARSAGLSSGLLDPANAQYFFAVLAWLFFAIVLNARITAGWRGRRTALLTIGGFASAVCVLTIYLAR